MTESSDRQDPRPSPAPAVLGILLAGLLLLALGLWSDSRRNLPRSGPTVTLLQPARDTTISGPIELVFQTRPTISPGPGGWRTGNYHLHALVNGAELMPAANDIRALGNARYSWILPASADTAAVQLVWALPNHQRLAEGASAVIRITRPLP